MLHKLKDGRKCSFLVLLLLFMCNSCFLFNAASISDESPRKMEQQTASKNDEDFQLQMIKEPSVANKIRQAEPEPQKTQYSGKAIAIPAPQFQKSTASDSWMPQFLQDTLTGHFASFSGMTVLDRKNESVVIAEQKLSESGYYAADNAAAFGQMTNAEYVLTGSVQKLPTRYALSFRVNDITTNEIKASFDGQYGMSDIENGNAVKDAVITLLKGLDITLTKTQIAHLTNNRSAINATQRLAQGMAAEKEGDFITALSFLTDASEEGNNEANTVISAMLSSSTPASIRERAAYYKAQTDKWNKIWKDVEHYMEKNYPILVYDFSNMKDEISGDGNTVKLTWSAGIKLVPNRKALVVYNTVCNEWEQVKSNTENGSWSRNVKDSYYHSSQWSAFYMQIGLYNEYGELLGTKPYQWENYSKHEALYGDYGYMKPRFKNEAIPPQFRLFSKADFHEIEFSNIRIDDKFTNTITPRIIEFSHFEGLKKISNLSTVMSLSEWEQYLKAQE